MKTKVIAMYLPQFHCIPENDEFWGKGFTDWVTVKKSKSLFEGHNQPRVPLNKNYYDLSLVENVEWQAKIAHENRVYGFGVYHYWFNNDKNLLTKPAEILRDSKNIKLKYFLVWDNCLWKRSWSNVAGNDWAPLADVPKEKSNGVTVLIPYILGTEPDWENHYNYMRTHFLSDNYEKKNNKPVFSIFWYSSEIDNMCRYMNELAKKDGFDGIEVIYKYRPYKGIPEDANKYYYQPHYSGWEDISLPKRIWRKVLRTLHIPLDKGIITYDYDKVWKNLLRFAKAHPEKNVINGAFVSYDDTPRRGATNSKIVVGETPKKFSKYLKELIAINDAHGKDYVFLTAWNEWGEGAYLEPDETTKYQYLEAVKEALK